MNKYSNYIIIVLLGLLLISFGFNISSLFNNETVEEPKKEEVVEKVSKDTKKLLTSAFPEDKYDYKDIFSNDSYYYTTIYIKGTNEILGYYFVDVNEGKVFRLDELMVMDYGSSFSE